MTDPQDPQKNEHQPSQPPTVNSLAHDLRQPLHVLQIGLTLLKSARTDEQKFDEVMELLVTNQKLLADLTEDLLKVARQDSSGGAADE